MFSSTQLFTEVLIVGMFLIVGFSPLLIRFFMPKGETLRTVVARPESKSWITLALVLALVYALGIAGNRLLEGAIQGVGIAPGKEFEQKLQDLTKGKPAKVASLETVELLLRDHSEGAKEWVDRHHSYRRILLAGAFASFLLLGSMVLDQALKSPRRYRAKHFVAAAGSRRCVCHYVLE